jgi:hypothetical protein
VEGRRLEPRRPPVRRREGVESERGWRRGAGGPGRGRDSPAGTAALAGTVAVNGAQVAVTFGRSVDRFPTRKVRCQSVGTNAIGRS